MNILKAALKFLRTCNQCELESDTAREALAILTAESEARAALVVIEQRKAAFRPA